MLLKLNFFKNKNQGQIMYLNAYAHHTLFGENVVNYIYIYFEHILYVRMCVCVCLFVCLTR